MTNEPQFPTGRFARMTLAEMADMATRFAERSQSSVHAMFWQDAAATARCQADMT